MHKIPVTLCLLWLGYSLSAQSLKTVEVAQAYKDRDRINLSNFAESIEYIQLETNEETLLSYPTVRGIQGDSIILVKSRTRICIFDRATGKYLYDVGHMGEDPTSFTSTNNLGFNNLNGNVFATRKWNLIEFSLKTGQVVNQVPEPDLSQYGPIKTFKIGERGSMTSQINYREWMDEGYLAGYISNHAGDETMKLIIYDTKGGVKKLFKNHRTYERVQSQMIKSTISSFHSYGGKSFFKEHFSDTLYSFNLERMTPEFFLNTGKYSPPYERQDELTSEQKSNLMFINAIEQDNTNLYFQLEYKNKWRVGLFNKKTNQTFISDPESDELNGFYNDLDNFVPFVPKFRTQEGYLVGTISAEDVYTWFQENRSRANKLQDHLKKFRNIDPEDNPIVMIVKPKGAN
ncbi:MAG: 6-bladed beta-propeller [Cytophagia bacterium]|nr:6-bladed beta-propeller [Cytophagia bacterium]